MEVGKQTKLHFDGVDFIQVNVNVIKRLEGEIDLESNINPKVFYPANDPSRFTIIFDVSIISKDFFNIAIIAFGHFRLDENIPEGEIKKAFVNTNAPAIMFPYVRAFITTLTANLGAGVAPLIMPPHFFKGQLEELSFAQMEETTK